MGDFNLQSQHLSIHQPVVETHTAIYLQISCLYNSYIWQPVTVLVIVEHPTIKISNILKYFSVVNPNHFHDNIIKKLYFFTRHFFRVFCPLTRAQKNSYVHLSHREICQEWRSVFPNDTPAHFHSQQVAVEAQFYPIRVTAVVTI